MRSTTSLIYCAGRGAFVASGSVALVIALAVGQRSRAADPTPPAPSFIKDVAPLLVAKCGRCHVSNARGRLSMNTFESLMKGLPNGPVIIPGDVQISRIMTAVESGKMPKGGPKLSDEEIATLASWVKAGAKFDGPDVKVPLNKLVPAVVAKQHEGTPLTITVSTGKESVHFSTDVAPVIVAKCVDCHTRKMTGGQLRMDSFRDILAGGANGNLWKPGNPDDSLLIRKLKGRAGARMPLRKPALDDDVIAKFETWIKEGATFDGANPAQSLSVLASTARAKVMTHDALSAERLEQAQRQWRLADPTEKPLTAETKNFYLIGNVNQATLDEAAVAAESQAAAVAKLFRAPADQPLVKGRITLFLFPTRYEYSEFGRMVEQRDLPTDWRGHWKYDSVDAYGVMVAPDGGSDYSLADMIGQQVGSIYAASLAGNPPPWFSEGVGRVVAARADGKSSRVHRWNERLDALFAGGKLDGFLEHKLPPEDTDIAAYGFAKDLMASGSKFSSLIVALRGGEEFEPAFTRIFGPPQKAVSTWMRSVRPL
jgi:mono/diheme cytochrome c family protein